MSLFKSKSSKILYLFGLITFIIASLLISFILTKKKLILKNKASETKKAVYKPLFEAGEILVMFQEEEAKRLSSITNNRQKKNIEVNSLDKNDYVTKKLYDVLNKEKINSLEKVTNKTSKIALFDTIYKLRFNNRDLPSSSEKYGQVDQNQLSDFTVLDRVYKLKQYKDIIKNVAPNSIFTISEIIPNDTYFNNQWALKNTSNPNSSINATNAWSVTQGVPTTIIAVIDTGTYKHLDFSLLPSEVAPEILWQNTDEIPNNNADDDSNGYIDDSLGVNLINPELNKDYPVDDNGHGTHVAGIIAARTNNQKGVAGVCPNCKIMSIKSFDSSGHSSLDILIQAIDYAVENGAQIINASWGGNSYGFFNDIVNSAMQNNVLFVASAGNSNDYVVKTEPANIPGVLTVGAIDNLGARASFSNFDQGLDLVAPGVNILSTYVPDQTQTEVYKSLSGTSMAAPHIAGIAGLVKSKYNSSAIQIYKKIINSARNNLQWNNLTGFGNVDSLQAVNNQTILTTAAIINISQNKYYYDVLLPVYGYAFSQNFSSYKLEIGQGTTPFFWSTNNIILANNGQTEILESKLADINYANLTPGIWSLKLTVYNQDGSSKTTTASFNKNSITLLYVDKNSTQSIENGSVQYPYKTIAKAINNSSIDSTIIVKNGEYIEDIGINKNGTVIKGEDPAKTVVTGSVIIISENLSANIENVKIENLTIKSVNGNNYPPTSSILISGPAKNITIRGNNLVNIPACSNDNCNAIGIQCQMYNKNIDIDRNTVVGYDFNIITTGFSNDNINITNNYLSKGYYSGLILQPESATNVKVTKNTFINNKFGIIDWGKNQFTTQTNYFINNRLDDVGFLGISTAQIINNSFIKTNSNPSIYIGSGAAGSKLVFSDEITKTGNYWSAYSNDSQWAFDNNNDGIVDSAFNINNNYKDSYPYRNIKGHGQPLPNITINPLVLYAGDSFNLSRSTGMFGSSGKVILDFNTTFQKEADVINWAEMSINAKTANDSQLGYHDLFTTDQNGTSLVDLLTNIVVISPDDYSIITPTPSSIPTLIPSPTPEQDFNMAIKFDDILLNPQNNGWVEVPASQKLLLGENFTIEGWMKPYSRIINSSTAGSGLFSILSKQAIFDNGISYPAYLLGINAKKLNFKLSLKRADDTWVSGPELYVGGRTNLEADKWYFIKVIRQNNKLSLYLNGLLEEETTFDSSLAQLGETVITPLYFGCFQVNNLPGTCFSKFAGELDEIRISNIARVGSYIPPEPFDIDQNTVGLWRFNNNVLDAGTNNLHGQINGTVQYISHVVSTVNPSLLIVTPSPTLTPTKKPTPTPTKIPSPTPTKIPTPKPKPTICPKGQTKPYYRRMFWLGCSPINSCGVSNCKTK